LSSNYFEKANFNYAWELPTTIKLFNKDYPIIVSADAYFNTEKVTSEQNNSYASFINNKKQILRNVEESLIDDAGTKEKVINRYIPKIIKIKRTGELGIVFDDKDDFENGLVIVIYPAYRLMSTDEFF